MNLAPHYQILGLRRGASAQDVKAAYRKLVRRYHPDINPDKAAIEQFIKINDAYTVLLAADHAREAKAARSEAQAQTAGFGLDNTLSSLIQTLEKMGLGSLHDSPTAAASKSTAEIERHQVAPSGAQAPTNEAGEAVSSGSRLSDDTFVNQQISDRQFDRQFDQPSDQQAARPLSMQEAALKQEAYAQLKELLRQQKFPRAIALVEGLVHRMPTDTEITQWQAIVYQRWGRRLIEAGQPQKARIYLKKALRTDPSNQALWREINLDFWQLANLDGHSSPIS